MTELDFRALCAEAAEHLSLLDDPPHQLVIALQEALAQPAPEPPTDEDLDELWMSSDWYNEGANLREFRSIARAVLTRWGQGNG